MWHRPRTPWGPRSLRCLIRVHVGTDSKWHIRGEDGEGITPSGPRGKTTRPRRQFAAEYGGGVYRNRTTRIGKKASQSRSSDAGDG